MLIDAVVWFNLKRFAKGYQKLKKFESSIFNRSPPKPIHSFRAFSHDICLFFTTKTHFPLNNSQPAGQSMHLFNDPALYIKKIYNFLS